MKDIFFVNMQINAVHPNVYQRDALSASASSRAFVFWSGKRNLTLF